MKKILIICLTLFIFSCSENKDKSFVGDNKINFISSNGIPVVEGKINDIDCYFIIDSGASLSVLNEAEKNRFGFSSFDSDMEAAGYGGSAVFKEVVGVDIEIGGIKFMTSFKSQNLTPIVDIIYKTQGIRISGIIGSDIMHKNNFVINYSEKSISLVN